MTRIANSYYLHHGCSPPPQGICVHRCHEGNPTVERRIAFMPALFAEGLTGRNGERLVCVLR